MRPTRDLRNLQRTALARTERLNAYIGSTLTQASTHRSARIDSAVAFVVIELDNLWVGVARSFFLSVAFCARDGTGNHVELTRVARAQSANDALTHAIRRCRGSRYRPGRRRSWTWRDEPLWWKPGTLLDALDEVGASNYGQVSAEMSAMSASPRVFSYLHTFRNFYAHRSERTRAQVVRDLRHLQFPTTYTATIALTSPVVWRGHVRPQPLILDWLDDIRNTISLLV